MRITKKRLKSIIRETLLTEAVPGTLGKWVSTNKQGATEWWLPVRGKYGGLVIGSIQYFTPGMYSKQDAKPGWRWRIHDKDWKGFNIGKHDKLIKKDNRNAYPKGDFIQNDDPDFGETLKAEVEAEIVKSGGIMRGDIDTSKPPPAAAALVKGTAGIEGVKVGDTSERGVKVTYELEGVTGAGARAQLKKLLQPLGFSGFNPGRYHGGGMAGFRGGPQKAISAVFDQGGRIFANFSTWTEMGEKTTAVDIRAEWSHDERDSS